MHVSVAHSAMVDIPRPSGLSAIALCICDNPPGRRGVTTTDYINAPHTYFQMLELVFTNMLVHRHMYIATILLSFDLKFLHYHAKRLATSGLVAN